MTTQPHFVLPDTTLKPEQVQALLAALPGKISCELMLDWPCEGQVALWWWDKIPTPEDHHFDGFDFKVIHDEGETDTPIWQLLAQAIPAMKQLGALLADRPASWEVLAVADAANQPVLGQRVRDTQDAELNARYALIDSARAYADALREVERLPFLAEQYRADLAAYHVFVPVER